MPCHLLQTHPPSTKHPPYTVFRVGRITPHPDHRHLCKQAKKNLEPFSISSGSLRLGSQASYIQPMLNITFFGNYQKYKSKNG